MTKRQKTIIQRFEEKIEMITECGCWIWIGGCFTPSTKNPRLPYGKFWINNSTIPAHRASWLIYHGAIPEKLLVLHKCDTPQCVNPNHLFIGTEKDNTADMIRKNRHIPMVKTRLGEKNNFSKLTRDQVIAIRQSRVSQTAIASKFGITQTAVSRIKLRKNWKHVA